MHMDNKAHDRWADAAMALSEDAYEMALEAGCWFDEEERAQDEAARLHTLSLARLAWRVFDALGGDAHRIDAERGYPGMTVTNQFDTDGYCGTCYTCFGEGFTKVRVTDVSDGVGTGREVACLTCGSEATEAPF